jgi:hypothetical protein
LHFKTLWLRLELFVEFLETIFDFEIDQETTKSLCKGRFFEGKKFTLNACAFGYFLGCFELRSHFFEIFLTVLLDTNLSVLMRRLHLQLKGRQNQDMY